MSNPTKQELLNKAKELGLKGVSILKKEELAHIVKLAQNGKAPRQYKGKVKIGAHCIADIQCYTNRCHKRSCVSKTFKEEDNKKIKVKIGEACKGNNQCYSNLCQKQKCASKAAKKEKVQRVKLGEVCKRDIECYSKKCEKGRCSSISTKKVRFEDEQGINMKKQANIDTTHHALQDVKICSSKMCKYFEV